MNFNFGEVLTRAWKIIWKHKVLWIFGILASCGRSSGNFNSNSGGGGGGNGGGFGQTPNLPPQALRWLHIIENNLTTVIIIGVALVCIIWIVTIFLSTIGRIGLIRGTAQADSGEEKLIFGQLFSESTPYFWRMFGLTLLLGIPILIFVLGFVAIFVGLAVSADGGTGAAAFSVLGMLPILIGCLCLVIPGLFVLGMIFRQAENAIVLEEMSIIPAISRGWDVFKKNLGPIIIMAIILAVIGFIMGLVVAIPFFIIVFPAMLAYFAGGVQSSTPLIFMGVCICLYIPVALALQGIMTAYTESAWTLTYMRLTKPQDNSPILAEANA